MKWTEVKKMILKYESFIKGGIFVVLLGLAVNLISLKRDQFIAFEWGTFICNHWSILTGLIALTFVNWGLEAKKWQLLTKADSLLQAYRAVLLGLAFKQFFPFGGLSDIAGRALAVKDQTKRGIAGAFLLSSFYQFSISVLMGSLGVLWLLENTSYKIDLFLYLGIVLTLILIVVFFYQKDKVLKKINDWFFQTRIIKKRMLWQLFCVSLLRYLVFFFQAVVTFHIFNPMQDIYLLLAGITFVFCAKTILPSFGFLGDLGIREVSAVFFFNYFGLPVVPVILASLLIWTINIFLPSIVAVFFSYKLRFS